MPEEEGGQTSGVQNRNPKVSPTLQVTHSLATDLCEEGERLREEGGADHVADILLHDVVAVLVAHEVSHLGDQRLAGGD
jgi:hypothetical protein